jgi:hypothetical protein
MLALERLEDGAARSPRAASRAAASVPVSPSGASA